MSGIRIRGRACSASRSAGGVQNTPGIGLDTCTIITSEHDDVVDCGRLQEDSNNRERPSNIFSGPEVYNGAPADAVSDRDSHIETAQPDQFLDVTLEDSSLGDAAIGQQWGDIFVTPIAGISELGIDFDGARHNLRELDQQDSWLNAFMDSSRTAQAKSSTGSQVFVSASDPTGPSSLPTQPHVADMHNQSAIPGTALASSSACSPFRAYYQQRATIPDISIEDVTGSWSVICPIISTYIDRLHPLFPAVHRPTFTDKFMRRADRTDITFRSIVLGLGMFVRSGHPL